MNDQIRLPHAPDTLTAPLIQGAIRAALLEAAEAMRELAENRRALREVAR